MSKICPNCQEVFDDNHGFCSNCGSRLVDNIDLNPMLNLGDANAISGGVNINQSKNITSHDTHYHTTTVQERAKSDSELKLDATNQLRSKAEEIMEERGRIDSVAMSQLRPMASHLGIDDETFKNIIKEVRSNRNGGANGLSAANARYLQQAQQAVQTNDMDSLSNLTPRLEAMAAISQDDDVQYLYYLTLSILYPIKSMDVYERQTDENYWRSFWAIISYIRTGKYEEATKVLALFDPLRYEKSEDDQNLLEAYFNIMKEDKDGAQEFLDEILGEPTAQTKPLLRAVESTLYEEEAETLEVRFYMERVMSKSDVVVKSQKKMDAPVNIEEPTKKESKPESKQKEQPKIEAESKQTINKDNIDASELYERACTASGAKRVMLLQKAADAGSLEAMFDLGECYYDGEGVDKNIPLAIKWMRKAADAGYTNAQLGIGMAYFSGVEDGLDQNYALSEKYLLLAANKDNTEAQAYLSVLYVNMEEYSKALVWARKASQTSNPTGYYILGRIYNEGLGVEVDQLKGLEYFEESANNGDADAQNLVGNIYTDADFVEHDYKKAFDNYQKAAAQGHAYGMLNLGLCYQDGQGTKKNSSLAKEWIQKAADAGVQEAIDILNNNPLYADLPQDEEDELTEEEEQVLYNERINDCETQFKGKTNDVSVVKMTSDVKEILQGNKPQDVIIYDVKSGYDYFSITLTLFYKIQFSEGCFFKVVNTWKPLSAGKTIQNEDYYYIDNKDVIYPSGNIEVLRRVRDNSADSMDINYIKEDGNIGVDRILDWNSSIFAKDMGINASGRYTYKTNLSVYDLDDNLIASFDHDIRFQYNKKFIKNDEVKVIE